MIEKALASLPVVAILRGVKPKEVPAIGEVLYNHGVRCIEVPLNSPSPFDSVAQLARSMPDDCLVGAGTVMTDEDVRRVIDAGGKLIVSPNTSPAVIRAALSLDAIVLPGVATPTEAFTAIASGATYLKLFPACTYGAGHLKSMLAVLPPEVKVLAVGGIKPGQFAEWLDAGAAGFGIGSEIYHAGDSVADVKTKIAMIRNGLD